MNMGAQRVRSYSLLAKCMHWAFMGIFAYAVINQVDEVEELENFTLLMKEVLFAIIFLFLPIKIKRDVIKFLQNGYLKQ